MKQNRLFSTQLKTRTVLFSLFLTMCSGFYSTAALIVANGSAGNIYSVDSSGNKTELISGLSNPWGVDSDSSGNIYVAELNGDKVGKYASDGTTINASLISGYKPIGIAFNSSGNFAVSKYNSPYSYQLYTTNGSTVGSSTTFANGGQAQGIDFDTAGNLYVAINNNKTILKYDSSGNQITSFTTNLGTSLGNGGVETVFVTSNSVFASSNGGYVFKFDLDGNIDTSFDSDGIITVSGAKGLAVEGNTLYVGQKIQGANKATFIATYNATTGALIDSNFSTGYNDLTLFAVAAVPEPSTYALILGFSMMAFVFYRRRKISQ